MFKWLVLYGYVDITGKTYRHYGELEAETYTQAHDKALSQFTKVMEFANDTPPSLALERLREMHISRIELDDDVAEIV